VGASQKNNKRQKDEVGQDQDVALVDTDSRREVQHSREFISSMKDPLHQMLIPGTTMKQ
jgi:hypothetical protein